MSIKSALESEGIDFSQVMNPPLPMKQAKLKEISGQMWACCPYCHKKAILIHPTTKIKDLSFMCKGSNCKKEFMVNV